MRGLRLLAWIALGLLALVVVGCLAEVGLRLYAPENTRHARFGTDCREIHAALAAEDGKAPPAHCIRVHYGTPRAAVGTAGDADFGYGRKLDDRLHLGYADVSLPLLAGEEKDGQEGVRRRGEVDLKPDGAPSSKDDTVRFAAITTITEAGKDYEFVSSLNEALAESDSNALLVFVHGYNQSFDTAVLRAAQIAVDLTFNPDDPANIKDSRGPFGDPAYSFGRPVLFSWPNANFLCAYCLDQDNAERSAPYLAQFLGLLIREADVDEINLVVHSMGNRVLVEAIEEIAREHTREKRIKTFRIVHAAADVATDAYESAMAAAEMAPSDGADPFAPKVTIYASPGDVALTASYVINGLRARLGQILPRQLPFVMANERYVTIDTDVVSADLFGHGYYSENGNVIADMSCFFADRALGSERAVAPVKSGLSDGKHYYRFTPPSESGIRVCAPGVAPLVLADAEGYFNAYGLSYEDYSSERMETLEEEEAVIVMEAPSSMAPPEATALIVFFPRLSVELSAEAAAVLEEGAREIIDRISAGGSVSVRIIGHADTSERTDDDPDAMRLSMARAEVVKSFLIARGVPIDIIEADGRGVYDPIVPTPDDTREPQNRRVTIDIVSG